MTAEVLSTTETALLAVAALHLGFQAVVTVVVYPALVQVPEASWASAHDAHGRRISYLVVPLYLGVLAVVLAVLADGVDAAAGWLAIAGQLGAVLVTATLAAPLHGRLGRSGPEPALLQRLLVVDRVRCALVVVGAVGAGLVVLPG